MTEAAFTCALRDPALPAPPGLQGPHGAAVGRRFDIYRNNVVSSLSDALETGFPVLQRLLGPAFFRAMAGAFLRAHPPASPVLSLYGTEMPGFLRSFPPVHHLPYLPDIARLELAIRRAYHAADPPAFDPSALAALPPDRLPQVQLRLAAAVQVVASDYPVHAIWHANTVREAPPPAAQGAQSALVTRPEFDPCADPLSPAGGVFVAALIAGEPLGRALDAALAIDPGTDPAPILALLVRRKAICGLTESDLP